MDEYLLVITLTNQVFVSLESVHVSTRDERDQRMVFIVLLSFLPIKTSSFFFSGLAAHPTVFLWADFGQLDRDDERVS